MEASDDKKERGNEHGGPIFYYRTKTVGGIVNNHKSENSDGKIDYSLFKNVVRIHLRGSLYAFLTEDELKNYKNLKRINFEPDGDAMWSGTLARLEVNEKVDNTKKGVVEHLCNLLLPQAQ